MKNLSENDKKIISAAMKFATASQMITFFMWSIFKPKKCENFIKLLHNGMNWRAAYKLINYK